MNTCAFQPCSKPPAKGKRGYCPGHFMQHYRNQPMSFIPRTTEERFWAKIKKAGPDECWLWQGSNNGKSHGHLRIDGVKVQAHRYSYELVKGPIPEGLSIDHKCRNGLCVNPQHLQAVTHEKNMENLGVRSDNTTGYRGVVKVGGKYRAQARKGSHRLSKSGISTLEEAIEIAKEFRSVLFTNSLEDLK